MTYSGESAESGRLKILYGYPYYPSKAYTDVKRMHELYIERLRTAGFDVEGFCLTLNPPAEALSWPQLDKLWRRGDRTLLTMYSELEAKLDGKDVLINSVGMNLHPEFVEQLNAFTVFQCFDDPENSANLSRPAAASYDLCLVGNAAEVESYRNWGVSRAHWTPLGLIPGMYDPNLTLDTVINGERDIDMFMMMDRAGYQPRWERLDKLAAAFPSAHFYGNGWPRGYLPAGAEVSFLQRTKIGPNLHNSTGPINLRTYYLPANGVLQVCDNRKHLGTVFEVGREVVGFETIEECIDLCRYYLAHDQERREIAAAGWKRVHADYNEVAVFARVLAIVRQYIPDTPKHVYVPAIAATQRRRTMSRRLLLPVSSAGSRVMKAIKQQSRTARKA